MNIIKQLRHSLGYTQSDLVAISGLSLRTIQRTEAGTAAPKGYTLKMLAHAFDVDPDYILEAFQAIGGEDDDYNSKDLSSLMWMNLSILAFIGIPFGNLILPLIVRSRNRTSEAIDDIGARMISIQILWSVVLCLSLCIAPLVPTSFPLIFIVLFIMMAANIAWVFYSAYAIQRDRLEVFDFPIKLIP